MHSIVSINAQQIPFTKQNIFQAKAKKYDNKAERPKLKYE